MRFDDFRVLHCPHLVGGHATTLAQKERQLGARSLAVSWEKSVFGYPADEILWKPSATLMSQEQSRWGLLLRALTKFNVIHYNYGTPILNWGAMDGRHRRMALGFGGIYASLNQTLELPLLRSMGKIIAVTYQGDDARQGDFCRGAFDISIAHEVGSDYYSELIDQTKRNRILQFSKYADVIYALNPDLLHVLPKHARFLPYAHIDLDVWAAGSKFSQKSRPLIVHAPSHRGAKGTKYLVEAVNSLKKQNYEFDFRLVEGLSQQEAKSLYMEADLVVDQLLAGWYGGFAVEAMALGKPVICYLREGDFKFVPKKMIEDLPIIQASPTSIEGVLKDLISKSPAERVGLGTLSRKYVGKWHDPLKIARKVLLDYQEAMKLRHG